MKEIKKSASFKSKQKGKEVKFNIDLNYSPEYDSFNIKVKEGEGFMSYSWNIERMPLEVVQKLNEMLEEVLIKAGSEYEMKEHKMSNGGDFQAGVYAKGGSLQAHGIEVGDTFVKTIMGGIQKVKDKNGKIVYIDLSTGERDSQPPLPFADGGGVGMEEDIDMSDDTVMRVRKPTMPEKKLTEQEWAEKHNAGAYEYMGKTKMATGGGVERINEGDKVTYKGNSYMVSKIVTKYVRGLYDVQYHLYPLKRNVEAVVVDNSKFIKKLATGGALIGNQKRIDMNHNGKIDAEDFKLLRSSMNGAYRNERKHVNHSEDYEVRYAKPRPNRTGYKGKRKFGDGGGISNFERLSRVVAKNYEGKRVKPKYQNEYGKVYSKSEAKEVGNKVAGKVKKMQKAESGAEVKKGTKGGVMVLAKQIRKDGESWKDAMKRASQQLK